MTVVEHSGPPTADPTATEARLGDPSVAERARRARARGDVGVALLGAGVVGTEVARLLRASGDDLARRVGVPLRLRGVAVRDAARPRDPLLDGLLTDDAAALVVREDVDVVVEVTGDTPGVADLLVDALGRGAGVVSANKAVVARDGARLHAAARAGSADLYYEASVGGAIPLLRPLRESLAGDQVRRVLGIVNGTTNFVLTRMEETGATRDDAVAEAQRLGYAEADPTADVGGHDAASKAAILASLAFHTRVVDADVHREGLEAVRAEDVAAAAEDGCVVKLLAVAEQVRGDDGAVGVVTRVHPAMLPATHPLASVRGAYNAVFVEADAAGPLMFYGQGAGGAPTASAVVGDLVACAHGVVTGSRRQGESAYADLPVLDVGAARTRYSVDLSVTDRPGVLAAVAEVFARRDVSIATVRQVAGPAGASLRLTTHEATERALAATVADLAGLDVVAEVAGVLRVEGLADGRGRAS